MALTKIGKEGITGIDNSSDATAITIDSSENVTMAGTLDVTGDLTVDTSTLKVDSANNRVGINTTGSVRDLQIGDNSRSASILSLQTNSSGNGSIYFGDNTTTNAEYGGMIRYSHSDNAMLFWTSSTERARLDSSGNLLVGTTNTNPAAVSNSVGISALASGKIEASRDGNSALAVNRKTSDGIIASFHKDASLSGVIGVNGGRPYFGADNGSTGSSIQMDSAGTIPRTRTGGSSDGALNLGASGSRWQDLYLSGGLYVGGTGSANKLDDYEEGTFTPNLIGDTGGEASYVDRSGTYTKVGRLVTCNVSMTLSSTNTMSGDVRLNTLPFTIADTLADTSVEASGSISFFGNLSSAHSSLSIFALSGGTNADFFGVSGTSNTSASSLTVSQISNSFSFRLTISYFTS